MQQKQKPKTNQKLKLRQKKKLQKSNCPVNGMWMSNFNSNGGISKHFCCCCLWFWVVKEREDFEFSVVKSKTLKRKVQKSVSPSRSCCVPELVVCVCFVYTTFSFGWMLVTWTWTTDSAAGFLAFALKRFHRWNFWICDDVMRLTRHHWALVADLRLEYDLQIDRMSLSWRMRETTRLRKLVPHPVSSTFHRDPCKNRSLRQYKISLHSKLTFVCLFPAQLHQILHLPSPFALFPFDGDPSHREALEASPSYVLTQLYGPFSTVAWVYLSSPVLLIWRCWRQYGGWKEEKRKRKQWWVIDLGQKFLLTQRKTNKSELDQ